MAVCHLAVDLALIHRIAVIEHHAQLLRAIGPADGPLVCQAWVTHDVDGFHVTAAEVTDTKGHVVATAGFTSIATPINAGVVAPAERLPPPSCSVTSWALPDSLGAVGRRGLAPPTRHRTRYGPPPARRLPQTRDQDDVGDGFLALFDVPARAVQCARSHSRRTPRRGDGGDNRPSHRSSATCQQATSGRVAVHAAARILDRSAGTRGRFSTVPHRFVTSRPALVCLYEDAGRARAQGVRGGVAAVRRARRWSAAGRRHAARLARSAGRVRQSWFSLSFVRSRVALQ